MNVDTRAQPVATASHPSTASQSFYPPRPLDIGWWGFDIGWSPEVAWQKVGVLNTVRG
jgi:hypothetical protein